MKHLILPDNNPRRLVFYLAMEEFAAKHIDLLCPEEKPGEREVFFIWQVPPTVIFGRNQVMEAEVNLAYCKEHGVQLYRRKSGGGCVYSDMGNIMLSYISDNTDVAFTFDRYLQRLALVLRRIGLNAERSGRNDVLVDGKKVSGNAFFLLPKSSIVHGTMLFDTDYDALERAITPSDAKIRSKGVSSVRQHVTNIKGHLAASQDKKISALADIGLFKRYIIGSFCGRLDAHGDETAETLTLDEGQVKVIEEIEATYLDRDFIEGRNHSYTVSRKGKVEGAGEIVVELEIEGGTILGCHMSGDFFALKDSAGEYVSARLRGCRNAREAVEQALEGFPLERYVMNLKVPDFLDVLFK